MKTVRGIAALLLMVVVILGLLTIRAPETDVYNSTGVGGIARANIIYTLAGLVLAGFLLFSQGDRLFGCFAFVGLGCIALASILAWQPKSESEIQLAAFSVQQTPEFLLTALGFILLVFGAIFLPKPESAEKVLQPVADPNRQTAAKSSIS